LVVNPQAVFVPFFLHYFTMLPWQWWVIVKWVKILLTVVAKSKYLSPVKHKRSIRGIGSAETLGHCS